MSAPVFDAGTVSALTKKIQNDLQSGADPRKKAKSKGGDRRASGDPGLKPKPKPKPSIDRRSNEQPWQGKKRTRDGQEKPNGFRRGAVSKTSSIRSTPKAGYHGRRDTKRNEAGDRGDSKRGKRDVEAPGTDLRAIVNELGGTDEDFKLIEQVGSDSEFEGEAGDIQFDLKNDLQRMVKDLGFAQARAQDVEDLEEEEEDGEDEDDNDHEQAQEAQGHVLDADDGELEDFDDYEQGEDDEYDEASAELIAKAKQALQKLPTTGKPNSNGLVVEPQSEWHTIELPGITAPNAGSSELTVTACAKLHDYAKEILQEENERYAKINNSTTSANHFYSTIMSSGTLSDKISALTLSVQESPVHNVRTLENLVILAKKRNRGQAVEVLGALKDLLGPGSLLPSDRRLRNFAMQPALRNMGGRSLDSFDFKQKLPRPLTKAHLAIWAYEDWLKATYFDILKVMEIWCNDEIPYTRLKAVGYVYELLRDKPEQEANLLRLLVNKLGDTDKKIASKASYYILQVENSHPAMKALISSSVEADLLFRPHQSNHAKYYGLITLNQTVLSGKEETVARQLLDVYFAMFLVLLKKPAEESAPSAQPAKVLTKLNSKGEVQGGGSAPGKKAQKKAAAETRSSAAEEELRDKMLSAVLTGVNRAMPYVDRTSDFFDKHLDTLFRVTHSANFNTSVQALMLIQQLCGNHQAASDRFYRTLYESLLDPRILTSSKQALYLNLLYRALRSDLSVKRIKAFVKRILQTVAMHQPSFACAVIYLVRELEEIFPSLTAFIDQPEANDSEDEEVLNDTEEKTHHQTRIAGNQLSQSQGGPPRYDGGKRDPEHALAETSCLWELDPLRNHFHPSVALFAASLLKHEPMPSKPDLSTNTLINFLDRFAYRNPKKTTTGLRGHSIMQPLAAGDASGLIVTARTSAATTQGPLNTEGFRNKHSKDIAPDEVFFHRYFNTIGDKTDKAKKKREERRKRDEGEDEEDQDGEEEIWQALVESRPEIEGEEDEDEGFDTEDFEDEFDGMEEDEGVEIVGESEDGGLDGMDEDDESEGAFDFDEEDDALLGSDDEVPDGVALAADTTTTDEKDVGDQRRGNKRRKMLKSLPMFASVDDYAQMLEGEED